MPPRDNDAPRAHGVTPSIKRAPKITSSQSRRKGGNHPPPGSIRPLRSKIRIRSIKYAARTRARRILRGSTVDPRYARSPRLAPRLVSSRCDGLTCRGTTSLDRIAGSRLRTPRRASHGVDIATINPVRESRSHRDRERKRGRERDREREERSCVFHFRAHPYHLPSIPVYRSRRFLSLIPARPFKSDARSTSR